MANLTVVVDDGLEVEEAAPDRIVLDPGLECAEPEPLRVYVEPGIRLATGTPGTTSVLTAQALVPGDLVTVDTSGQLVRATSIYSLGHFDVVGVSNGTFGIGESAEIRNNVLDRVPMRFASAPLASSNGARVFLDAVSGVATLTPPSTSDRIIVCLGTLHGADGATTTPLVWFRPNIVALIS